MSKDNKKLKREATNRTYDHYGNPPAEQISKDIAYWIDKATLAEREQIRIKVIEVGNNPPNKESEKPDNVIYNSGWCSASEAIAQAIKARREDA